VQDTVGNEVGYRLKATCSWTHIDLTSHDRQPLLGRNGRVLERCVAENTPSR
jgi:hypothetical protein